MVVIVVHKLGSSTSVKKLADASGTWDFNLIFSPLSIKALLPSLYHFPPTLTVVLHQSQCGRGTSSSTFICRQVQWHSLTWLIRIQRPRSISSSLCIGTANSSSTRLPTHKKQPRSSAWGSIRKWRWRWEDTSSHRCRCRRYANRLGTSLLFLCQTWTRKGVITS